MSSFSHRFLPAREAAKLKTGSSTPVSFHNWICQNQQSRVSLVNDRSPARCWEASARQGVAGIHTLRNVPLQLFISLAYTFLRSHFKGEKNITAALGMITK